MISLLRRAHSSCTAILNPSRPCLLSYRILLLYQMQRVVLRQNLAFLCNIVTETLSVE